MNDEMKSGFSQAVGDGIELVVQEAIDKGEHPVANVSVTVLMDDSHQPGDDPIQSCSLQVSVICPDNMPMEPEAIESILILAASQYKALSMPDGGMVH